VDPALCQAHGSCAAFLELPHILQKPRACLKLAKILSKVFTRNNIISNQDRSHLNVALVGSHPELGIR
jgi:hypothetical protein